jgi:uncharacterized membrane protein YesL
MNVILSKYVYVLQKIYWFAYLQVLWMLFTLLGLGVFGIFPATHALITVLKEKDLSSGEAFREFRNAFTCSFIKLSGAALIWHFMFLLISTNLLIFQSIYLKYLVMGMIGLLFLSMIHFFQYLEMNQPIVSQVKRAFSFVWVLPKNNAGYFFILVLELLAIAFIPGITFFFGISIAAYFIVKVGNSEENKRLQAKLAERSIS